MIRQHLLRRLRPRALGAVAGALAGLALGGCYTYTPLIALPEPGTRLAVELNDRGRVELADHVGPEVAVIEGLLLSRTDSSFVLGVLEVRGLYGSRSQWAGEPVTLAPAHARAIRERRFDSGRTVMLTGVVATSFVAFVATRGLLGRASGENLTPGEGGPGTGEDLRPRN